MSTLMGGTGLYTVGQLVMRRDENEKQWQPGFVVALDPQLEVTMSCNNPEGAGFLWHEVRLPNDEESALFQVP